MLPKKVDRPKPGETFFTILLLIFIVVYVLYSFTYNVDARRSPLIIGSVAIVLLVLQVYKNIKTKDKKVDPEEEKIKNKRLSRLMIYIVATVIFAYLVGLLPALAIFILIFFKVVVDARTWVSVVIGAGVWVFLYLIFVKLLVLPVWEGIIIEAIL